MRLAECCWSSIYLGVALGRVSVVIAIPAAQLVQLHSLIGSMTGQEQVVAWVDFPCKALRSMNILRSISLMYTHALCPLQLQWTMDNLLQADAEPMRGICTVV